MSWLVFLESSRCWSHPKVLFDQRNVWNFQFFISSVTIPNNTIMSQNSKQLKVIEAYWLILTF